MWVYNTSLKLQDEIKAWSRDLNLRQRSGTAYLISTSYGVFRGRYNVGAASDDRSPTKADAIAGITRAMPEHAALEAQSSDVRKWYLRLLRELFGKNYGRYCQLHPVGIGWHDQPAVKASANDNRAKCLPGEKFPNSHIVLTVAHARVGGDERLCDRFDRLTHNGVLERKWVELVPEGTLDIRPTDDVERTLDYAAKTAKWEKIYREHGILLPFDRSRKALASIAAANSN